MFMDSINFWILIQKRFITPVPQFIENAVQNQVQIMTVQAHFQEAVRAPHDDHKLEPVEIPSPPERLLLPQALSSEENRTSPCRRG